MICVEIPLLFILISDALLTQSQVIRGESCKTGSKSNVGNDVLIKLKELHFGVLALSMENDLIKAKLKELQDRLDERDENAIQQQVCDVTFNVFMYYVHFVYESLTVHSIVFKRY